MSYYHSSTSQRAFGVLNNHPAPGRHSRRYTTDGYEPKPRPTYYQSSSPSYASSSKTSSTPSPPPRRHTYVPQTVDPILAYHSHPSNSLIEYDVSLPPSQIRVSSRSQHPITLNSRDRALPATTPPCASMTVTCQGLPWPVDIHASSASYVTVGDVLQGIHRALRSHVSAKEWNESSPNTQERVREAYYRRCKRTQNHKEWEDENRNGLRRIDWLGKTRMFAGLKAGRRDGEWVLCVRAPEKGVKFWAGQ